MNTQWKPFRLINGTELNHLQQRFAEGIQIWNDNYALHPLSCKLSQNPKIYDVISPLWLITDANRSISISNKKDHELIKQSVFGKNSDCFNTISETLLISLLNRLFGTESLQWHTAPNMDEYLYTGSPCLTLSIECDTLSTSLYLHPQWVVNALPQKRISPSPVSSLNDALATQVLPLQVVLSPIPLQLSNLIRLQVGDVIKTDHPITMPLLLKHDNETICNVDIGEQSIQITRTS